MPDSYFIITTDEDGECRVTKCSAAQIEKEVSDHSAEGDSDGGFASSLPANSDTATWGGLTIIIKGEIVKPKPAVTVKSWRVE